MYIVIFCIVITIIYVIVLIIITTFTIFQLLLLKHLLYTDPALIKFDHFINIQIAIKQTDTDRPLLHTDWLNSEAVRGNV